MAVHVRMTGKLIDKKHSMNMTVQLVHHEDEVSFVPMVGNGEPIFRFDIDELEEALSLARKQRLIKHGHRRRQ